MVTASCLVLAAALLVAPPRAGAGRLRELWPVRGRARSWRAPGATVAVVAGGVLGLVVAGPAGALSGMLVAATVRRVRGARRSAAAATGTAGELAAAVSRMADELAAGAHPAAALGGCTADGPHARDVLAAAAAASRLGDDVPHALLLGADRHPEVRAEIERLASAWTLSDRHGVPLAELLAGARADLVWRVQFAARVRAELAGPRATALVLTGLPGLGLTLGQLVGADPVGVLRGGLPGQALLVAGVVLAAAGVVWSEQILHGAVPR